MLVCLLSIEIVTQVKVIYKTNKLRKEIKNKQKEGRKIRNVYKIPRFALNVMLDVKNDYWDGSVLCCYTRSKEL